MLLQKKEIEPILSDKGYYLIRLSSDSDVALYSKTVGEGKIWGFQYSIT